MNRLRRVIGAAVLGLGIFLAASAHAAPGQLPEGPGRDVVANTCTLCHSQAIIIANRMSRENWDKTLDWMRDKQGMPEPDPETRKKILDYLATYLGVNSAPQEPQRPPAEPMYRYDYRPNPL